MHVIASLEGKNGLTLKALSAIPINASRIEKGKTANFTSGAKNSRIT